MKQPPFDWDDAKAAENLKKHGVAVEEAATVLRNALTDELLDEDHSITEERWIAIGHSIEGRLLFVCYSERGGMNRIISERVATKQETKDYESSEKIQRRRYDAP